MKPKSPLTGTLNTQLIKRILVSDINSTYMRESSIDTSNIFKDLEYIELYRCLDTDFMFYYPFNITGDSDFYKKLEKISWYYMDWKWEHENALNYFSNGKVLEVGCAQGSFIAALLKKNIEAIGLELNENAVEEGKKRGLTILNESIQTHATLNTEKYDVVCSFQVMEHIADIKDVIQSSINLLKKGGKLIISVPNNDSFLKLDERNYLNGPPHHMGLWNEKSLKNLDKIFNIKLIKIDIEPLQKYHQEYFLSTLQNTLIKKYSFIGKVANKALRLLSPNSFILFSKKFKGSTIEAVFEKL